jgi:trehalose/maltose hydrolase-like predicted phosphorylase
VLAIRVFQQPEYRHCAKHNNSNNNNDNNNSKNSSGRKVGQHTVKPKLKDDLQVTWHKIKLIQMSQRESLPELKENSKLIELEDKNNWNGTDDILEESKSDMTVISNTI